MNYSTALNLITDISLIKQHPIIMLTGTERPVLFIAMLLVRLRTLVSLQTIDITATSVDSIISHCSMSFLGQHNYFWLGDITILSEKKQEQLYTFLRSYRGMNKLLFFSIDEQKLSNAFHVVCNKIASVEEFLVLTAIISGGKEEYMHRYAQRIFAHYNSVTLEQAILLINYYLSLGARNDLFFDEWLKKIIPSEQSLFTLSSLFFNKQAAEFFKFWKQIEPLYSPIFWTTYWSEQLFRAYWFVYYCKKNQMAEAKKIGYRLPFSFMQHDWKKHSRQQLQQLHDKIYQLDCALKNNGTPSFDLLFAKFFNVAK